MSDGEVLNEVLMSFNGRVEKADFIVVHNISSDERIVDAEFLRKEIRTNFERKTKPRSMKSSTNYCQLSGPYG
jgi:hypothetical protein